MYYSINVASLMLYNADCSWCIHVYTVLYCNDVHACVGNARTGYCTVFLVLYICFDLVRKLSHYGDVFIASNADVHVNCHLGESDNHACMQILGYVYWYS